MPNLPPEQLAGPGTDTNSILQAKQLGAQGMVRNAILQRLMGLGGGMGGAPQIPPMMGMPPRQLPSYPQGMTGIRG